ncbi:MAG: tetratricopeptide repeat protein [Pseudomonadota bacterium]
MSSAALLAAALLGGVNNSSSRTVIGPDNRFLADGAQALLMGDYLEGVRLTEIGLEFAHTPKEQAQGLSNLCAGLIKLEQFDLALEKCDLALELTPDQWRAHSNRANVLLQMGRLDEAEAAVERGLELRPKSPTLLKVLDAARLMRYDPTVTVKDEP